MSLAIGRLGLCFAFTVLVTSTPVLIAQNAKTAPPGPVPPQIATAKKIFIANAPGDIVPAAIGGNYRPYDQFYAGVKSWGKYELVSSPADADLIFEISMRLSPDEPLLNLVITDPKTRVPLWWFAEQIIQKPHVLGREKVTDAFDDAMAALVDDVEKLKTGPAR
ncbi:MAG: hypothetical protein WB817_10470 [Terriglobales bacterium]